MVTGDDDRVPEDPPAGERSRVSPDIVRSYRWQLTPGEDVIDPTTFAGSIPQVRGIAPRVRVGAGRWFNLLWLLPIGFMGLLIAVAVAKGLRSDPSVAQFIREHPGTIETPRREATTGFPAWARWQHFLNLFFLIFIIRSGLQILCDHPRLYWTRHSTPGKDWFRVQKAVPSDPLWTAKQDSISLPGQVGLPGLRHSIGLAPLVASRRRCPVAAQRRDLRRLAVRHRSVAAPRADQLGRVSQRGVGADPVRLAGLADRERLGGLQRAAADRVLHHRLRAAPLALITGLGMSPALSTRFKRISNVFSIQTARSMHFLVLVWFLGFIVMHVTFVFTTGLLVNLNHVYAGRTDGSWAGFWLFAASMVVVIVGWVAATPVTIRHPRVVQRAGQAIVGPLQQLFEHVDPKPGQYSEKDISPYFWHNGQYPDSDEYKALFDGDFADYRLRIDGLVDNPVGLDLAALRALPHHEQITQHFCIQGWSGVAKWGGVSVQTIVDLVKPHPEAKWVVFYSLGDGADNGVYYDAHPIEHMTHHLTMLAYDMNDEPLSFGHGAPLRLRNEIELGFKQVKWIKGIEFVTHYSDIGGGYGGYNQDHEFFGYRQSI